jgi:hypothetical protein
VNVYYYYYYTKILRNWKANSCYSSTPEDDPEGLKHVSQNKKLNYLEQIYLHLMACHSKIKHNKSYVNIELMACQVKCCQASVQIKGIPGKYKESETTYFKEYVTGWYFRISKKIDGLTTDVI